MDDTEQIKKLLKKNLEISEECYKLLKKVHRVQLFSRWFQIFKWSIIVILALGAYYYIQPILGNFLDTFEKIKASFSVFEDGTSQVFKNLINNQPK